MQRLHVAPKTNAAAEGEANQMRQNLKASMDEAERMPLDTEKDDFKDAGGGKDCAPAGGVAAGLLLGQMLPGRPQPRAVGCSVWGNDERSAPDRAVPMLAYWVEASGSVRPATLGHPMTSWLLAKDNARVSCMPLVRWDSGQERHQGP